MTRAPQAGSLETLESNFIVTHLPGAEFPFLAFIVQYKLRALRESHICQNRADMGHPLCCRYWGRWRPRASRMSGSGVVAPFSLRTTPKFS